MASTELLKKFILTELPNHPTDIVAYTAKKFSVTRTTIHRHLESFIKAGKIIKSGTTKNTYYSLSSSFTQKHIYKLSQHLDEFSIFTHDFKHMLENLPTNLQDTISYSFTEIVNNAIDHSKGRKLTITTELKKDQFILSISDDGIGVFKNIYDYLHLNDLRESILELTKGKITTDPNHHTGEGIFFSSKLPYLFEIYANGLHFLKDNKEHDWAITEDKTIKQGSKIVITYLLNSKTELVNVFKKFQDENLSFNRTEIIVELSKFNEEVFISRSQAKRILRNLEKFAYITLDFKGIRLIGQGFADEVFRVYQLQHPTTTIDYINANENVTFMIERTAR
jgi:hypothetical protein